MRPSHKFPFPSSYAIGGGTSVCLLNFKVSRGTTTSCSKCTLTSDGSSITCLPLSSKRVQHQSCNCNVTGSINWQRQKSKNASIISRLMLDLQDCYSNAIIFLGLQHLFPTVGQWIGKTSAPYRRDQGDKSENLKQLYFVVTGSSYASDKMKIRAFSKS